MFCGLFAFQSGICPVLGFGWYACKSRDLLLPQYHTEYEFLYYDLCCFGTEFLGSSKQGLYFHCKI